MTTSRIRAYRPEHHGTLKDAITTVVEQAGGLRAAAEMCRLNKTRLGEICSPHRDDVHAPLDVVLALELASGCHAVTEHLAARHGLLVVRIDGQDTAVLINDLQRGVMRQNAEAAKAAAEAISRQMESAADGVVTVDEAMAMLPAVETLLQQMVKFRHLLLVMTNDGEGDAID